MLQDVYSAEYRAAHADGDLGRIETRDGTAFTISAVAALCGLVATLTLICFTNYSRHLTAQGMVVPATGLTSVVSPAAGTVIMVRVTDGSAIKAGDVILKIDVGMHARSGRVAAVVDTQLHAEKFALVQERDLRIRQYQVERASLLDQQGVLARELANERSAGARQDQALSAMQRELQVLIDERRAGLSTNQQVQSQLYTVSQAAVARSQMMQSEASTLGQKLTVEQKLSDEPTTLATDLAKINAEVADLEGRIASNEPHDTIDIVAPIDGIVSALSVRAGQPLRDTEQVAVILPAAQTLVAEVYVDDAGAGHLRRGARATLELAAFPVQRYGSVSGHVTAVSEAPESPVAEEGGRDQRTERSGEKRDSELSHGRYRVWIAMDAQQVSSRGRQYRIPAGSRLTAHLSVETRPLLQWLLDPLRGLKAAGDDFSLGERSI